MVTAWGNEFGIWRFNEGHFFNFFFGNFFKIALYLCKCVWIPGVYLKNCRFWKIWYRTIRRYGKVRRFKHDGRQYYGNSLLPVPLCLRYENPQLFLWKLFSSNLEGFGERNNHETVWKLGLNNKDGGGKEPMN